MPRPVTGSVYPEAHGTYGIRWKEGSRRPQRGGFKTKTAARDWFNEEIKPRLRRGGPSPDVTLAEFTVLYLDRWGPTVSPRTVQTLREWLAPALEVFGAFTLAELEGAADDIARWRGQLPTEHKRYTATRALRQVLAAAGRWRYMAHNPAVAAGPNPQPRGEEILPLTGVEVERIVEEMHPRHGALVVFAVETGLRTNEWMAVERRDLDRTNPAVAVVRRWAKGRSTPYPKTTRRRVPLTPRALDALAWLPARLDTPLLFPTTGGPRSGGKACHIHLDNWRLRTWYPALEAAGVQKRGPYAMRHTFASNALAAGVSIFQLSRLMGTSVELLDRTYGHLVRDSEEHLRALLSARDGGEMADSGSGGG